LKHEFLGTDPKLTSALERFAVNPIEVINYFKNHSLLLGMVVDGSNKELLLSSNSNYKALAVFSNQDLLLSFRLDARPAIFTGRELVELTLNNGSGLIEIDPPAGVILTGSMARAILNDENWNDPSQNQELIQIICDFLHKSGQSEFQIERGIWTDIQIFLKGDLEKVTAVASSLGQFLSQSQTAVENLPSGADILYLES
jgi:hypothetical protein